MKLEEFASENLRVDSIVSTLREIDATADGEASLAAAQAGYTYPDDDHWIVTAK